MKVAIKTGKLIAAFLNGLSLNCRIAGGQPLMDERGASANLAHLQQRY